MKRVIRLDAPLDLEATLRPLAHGRGDQTVRLTRNDAWLAFRTPQGGAALHLRLTDESRLEAESWGDGGTQALEGAEALIGAHDRPEELVPRHRVIHELQRRHSGLRLPRSGRAFHALLPTILEQKVTGTEAFRSYSALLRRHGEPAPGPPPLLLPPEPALLARLPYHAFHPLGIERRRADLIRRAAARATWLEADGDAALSATRLLSIAGIGPWTVAEVARSAHGDADAVSVGDYHVPNSVAWALAGETRADDERMLELLEPYRGQRGRVQRLLEVGRISAPRFGPRFAPRSIATI